MMQRFTFILIQLISLMETMKKKKINKNYKKKEQDENKNTDYTLLPKLYIKI